MKPFKIGISIPIKCICLCAFGVPELRVPGLGGDVSSIGRELKGCTSVYRGDMGGGWDLGFGIVVPV